MDVSAWLNEKDTEFLAILTVALMENPEYKFKVYEEVLCVVREEQEKPKVNWTTTYSNGTTTTTWRDSSPSEPKAPPRGRPTENFYRSTHGSAVFVAFGKTGPEALRALADGLEAEGVEYIDGVSTTVEMDSATGDNDFCATAYVYPHS